MGDIFISAPGKLILHGEHAVVYGKRAIATSLNLRTFLKLRPLHSNYVKVLLPDISFNVQWFLSDIMKSLQMPFDDPNTPTSPSDELLGKLKCFAGLSPDDSDTRKLAVIAFLYLYCSIGYKNGELPSLEVHVGSALPTSSGLGSSAAYSTCLAASFLQFQGYIESHTECTEGSSHNWPDEDCKLINGWAFQAEKIIHGNPSGIDNAVSCYGGALRFQSGKITRLTRFPTTSVLLFNTKVPRSTKILVAGVRKKYNKYPEIMQPILDSMDALTIKCEALLLQICEKGSEPETYESLQELVNMNQQLLCMIGVSHPALDEICRLVATHGLHAKLTGAGGGGCAFTLIPPGFSSESVKEIQQDINKLGYDCWETQVGSLGVTRHMNITQISSLPDSFR